MPTNSGMTLRSDGLQPAAYQLVPFLKLLETGLDGILVSDGVGVGKTISAGYIITYFSSVLESPSLVIAPPSLVDKWLIEMRSRFGRTAISIRNSQEVPAAISEMKFIGRHHKNRVYVMSNSLLRSEFITQLPSIGPVIFDEIHTYRNRETALYKGALKLSKLGRLRIGLSATPINNSLDDIVSELSILLPDYDWETIRIVVEDTWLSEKESLALPLLTRFVKEKLGIHFARRNITNLRVSYCSEYHNWVRNMIGKISGRGSDTFGHFETITLFRLAASSPRAFIASCGAHPSTEIQDVKLSALKSILGNSDSSHILVFCEFKETVEHLAENIDFIPVYALTGDTPIFDRMNIIDEFKADDSGILIMTSVGSEGLDFQFADTVVNYDLHWNPMKIEQRIGRIDRRGQKKSEISVFNLIVDGSIDERVLTVVKEKLALVSDSVLGTNPILEKPSSNTLFDDSSIEAEIASSNRLAAALEWTRSIPSEDYDVLENIDLSFCSVAKLTDAAEEGISGEQLLAESEISNQYLIKLRTSTSAIKRLLNYYS